jgi:hypothetical protein
MPAIGAATPNVGKTHITHCRLIVDTVDLSGVSRQVGSLGNEHETTDVTGYSNGVHHVTIGHGNHLLTGYQAVFSNLAVIGSHTELKDLEEYIASWAFGVKAPPEIGSSAWLSSQEQLSYDVSANLVSVDFAKAITDSDHANPWGFVLEAATSRSESADLVGVDNLVPTTNGIVAHLQIVASSGTTWSFDIEESSDDENADNYVSIATFNADGATLVAERIDVAGAVERYLRLAIVRLGGAGTVSAWLTVARGLDI